MRLSFVHYDSGIGTSTACAGCHGSDGLTGPPGSAADYADWVGKIANDNPQEFLHKVRFGQPNTASRPRPGIVRTWASQRS